MIFMKRLVMHRRAKNHQTRVQGNSRIPKLGNTRNHQSPGPPNQRMPVSLKLEGFFYGGPPPWEESHCWWSGVIYNLLPFLLSGTDPCITSHVGYVRFPPGDKRGNEAQVKLLSEFMQLERVRRGIQIRSLRPHTAISATLLSCLQVDI